VVQGFWGKQMPLWGRKWQASICAMVSWTISPNSALLVGDGGFQVLDLDQALTDEDNFCDFADAGDPGVADELGVEGEQASGYRRQRDLHVT
jgi:hypothetical protein